MSIESLNSDLLIYLLSFLPNKELFKIESVNKKWQKYVRKLMDRRITEFGPNDLFKNAFKLSGRAIDVYNIDVINYFK